jgi:hypothetical protein
MLLSDGALSVDFELTTSGGPTTIQWYPEFARDNPLVSTTKWYRELAEEDVGAGVVNMPKTIRGFQENGGAGLADGVHYVSAQLVRRHLFVRLQMRVTAGAASAVATAPFGLPAAAP